MFLGSDTMTAAVEALVPTARIERHPRFSRLRGVAPLELTQLPPRSAVVAFSADQVYALAEQLRRRRGGAAVVLGALSPRTRNAQVAMYQAGEVDYIVATDAIGMGLNMDVDHVAFAALGKFDGRTNRPLEAAELAQIAGRAGRYTKDGTFGPLATLGPLPQGLVISIERHHSRRWSGWCGEVRTSTSRASRRWRARCGSGRRGRGCSCSSAATTRRCSSSWRACPRCGPSRSSPAPSSCCGRCAGSPTFASCSRARTPGCSRRCTCSWPSTAASTRGGSSGACVGSTTPRATSRR
ncbi:helicase-related protein [Nannocystis pusilla]|uniref:Helicase-related protein n=1 Tax=Nannocystis pusilla TaxID=889268 RepID=A0A9X3ES03_9BACT|nr:helicase-related protein [Nannocystis pusilla]MCY1008840.1 helicase-related protein [Nannocystis pusilla]